MKKLFLKLIRLYQNTLSPDHGLFSFLYSEGFCRFIPTCSEYTYNSIEKYGSLKGIIIGFYRINRCHPWAKGGFDPVPSKDKLNKFLIQGLLLIFLYLFIIIIIIIISSFVYNNYNHLTF